jgi:excisionase family DNA binding protein
MTGKFSEPRDAFLRIGEAAALAGVSLDTLRKWDRAGILRARRTLGRQRRYARNEVEELMSRGLGKSPSRPAAPLQPQGPAAVLPAARLPYRPSLASPAETPAPWDEDVAQARAELEILRAHAEAAALQRAEEQESLAAQQSAEEERAQQQAERRLEELKSYGRGLASRPSGRRGSLPSWRTSSHPGSSRTL